MSGNLTRHEVLQHRHLNLLKALEAQGISAHYSQQQGEWVINNKDDRRCGLAEAMSNGVANYGGAPEGAVRMSMAQLGLKLTEHFAPVLYSRTEGDEEITMSHATDDVWPTWAKDKFYREYGMLPNQWPAYLEELRQYKVRINNLLDALQAVIVPPSPAKVD